MEKILPAQPLSPSNVIGEKQLTKLKQVPLPASLDLDLTRIYFTSAYDGFSRILILIVQMFWIGLIFFNGIKLGQIVANLPQLPSLPALQNAVLQAVAMIFTIFFAFMILIMMLPVFLVKTIKSVILTCLYYLILGTIINLVIIGISFFMFFDSNSPYRITILVLALLTTILWWAVILNWWSSAKNSKQRLVKSIIKMYELGYK